MHISFRPIAVPDRQRYRVEVKDVDLAFFDPTDLSPRRDMEVEIVLRMHLPTVPWEAKNQAAVHTWYERRT